MKFRQDGGTHLPTLIKLLGITNGAILELGTGLFSTPYLHWACFENKRELVSYDAQEKYFGLTEQYACDYHKVHFVKDNNWDDIDISRHWSIVLIDHSPGPRRREEMKRVANNADYVVVHDTDAKNDWYYKYAEYFPLFKYRYDFNQVYPQTTILSNFNDLSCLFKKE